MAWSTPKKMPIVGLLEKMLKLLSKSAELEMRRKLLAGMAQLRALAPKDPKLQTKLRDMASRGEKMSMDDFAKLCREGDGS